MIYYRVEIARPAGSCRRRGAARLEGERMDYNRLSLDLHEKAKGKIAVASKVRLENRDDLSAAYTPGVAQPCREIAADRANVYKYTAKGNLVAVITDGTAVLGLGDIGPEAALPVMEGKAILFKEFGDVDAFPICLDTTDSEELIRTIKCLAPTFGGINLEDISSPRCFEIEERLEKELDIPVFHDDQHGTAIVVAAALINALKLVKKRLDEIRVVLNGPGSAGTAIIKMLRNLGVKRIVACDEHGILYGERALGIAGHKKMLCGITNPDHLTGTLADALKGADVFIGVSVPNALRAGMIRTMNEKPVVFAMANPVPEIMYDEAVAAGAAVVGTGRSDFPNQINNVLAFPGVFRGALDARARDINYEMKIAAAYAIAELVAEEELNASYIVPSPFDKRVAANVAKRVAEAAIRSGAAHR